MNPREICERYEKLYTGAVADILDERGFRRQCLGPALRPMPHRHVEPHPQRLGAGLLAFQPGRAGGTADDGGVQLVGFTTGIRHACCLE